jgi:hypothetical protein
MKIHIEPTSRIIEVVVDGAAVPARVWEGHTDNGIAVICCVTRIAARVEADRTELEQALDPMPEPSFDGRQAFPARLIL